MRKGSLLVIFVLLAPAAAAQVTVLEDAEGDAKAMTPAGVPVDVIDTDPYDLVSLIIEEEPREFSFAVKVVSLDRETTMPLEAGTINVDFQHVDQGYRVQFIRDTFTGNARYQARLAEFDSGRQQYVPTQQLPLDVDLALDTLTATVPRESLLDGNGTAPQAGRELGLFRVFARTTSEFTFGPGGNLQPVRIEDAMPDSGFGTIPYAVVHGLKQTGHAFLSSENPVRASNGEKATFVYYVVGENLRADEDTFRLSAKMVPDGWDVTLPAGEIRIAGNSTQRFPVLVSVPFQHQHGKLEQFTIELASKDDPGSVGRLQVGIRYLETPQPAGHHDTVYIHTRTEPQTGWVFNDLLGRAPERAFMNTLEDDESDEDVMVTPSNSNGFGTRGIFTWRIYLEPGLQMGLDFDLNRTGQAFIRIDSAVAHSGASIRGAIVHLEGHTGEAGDLRGAKETIVANLLPSQPQSLDGLTEFETVIQATKDGDFVPYTQHAALAVDLTLEIEGSGPGILRDLTPKLEGGQMRWPLNEYRDPVGDVFNDLAGLSFTHADKAEKLVNPGKVVLFNLTLSNEGAVDDVFTLKINGTNIGWARLLGDTKIFVPTGNSRPVVVAVAPPLDAPEGDIVDLIVTAASAAEPTIQGNIRVVATVDTIREHADESHLLTDVEKQLSLDKKSPGLPLAGALAVAGLVALGRRRHT